MMKTCISTLAFLLFTLGLARAYPVTSAGTPTQSVLNDTSTGTVLFTLTSYTTASPSKAILAPLGSTRLIGVTIAGAGKTGAALIQTGGLVNVLFDGATTAGDFFGLSTSNPGYASDLGTTASASVLGIVTTTNARAGTYTVSLTSPNSPGSASIPAGIQNQVLQNQSGVWTPTTSLTNISVNGAVNGIFNPTITPYNADNTGATDATTAIQNAYNDAVGGEMDIPPGTYKISGSGLSFTSDNTVVRCFGGATFNYSGNGAAITLSGLNSVLDGQGCKIIGTSSGTAGIKVQTLNHGWLGGFVVTSFSNGNGFYLHSDANKGNFYSTFINLKAGQSAAGNSYGFYIDDAGATSRNNADIFISPTAIFNANAGFYISDMTQSSFDNLDSEQNGTYGLDLEANTTNDTFLGNYLELNVTADANITAGATNLFLNCRQSASVSDFSHLTGAGEFGATNNIFCGGVFMGAPTAKQLTVNQPATSTTSAVMVGSAGQTSNFPFTIRADGMLSWGDGTLPRDASITRTSTGALTSSIMVSSGADATVQAATPATLTVTPTGGNATQHCYQVSGTVNSRNTVAKTEVCDAAGPTSLDSSHFETVCTAWPVLGYDHVSFYGRATGAEQLTSICPGGTNCQAASGGTICWKDDGSQSPSGAVPVVNNTGSVSGFMFNASPNVTTQNGTSGTAACSQSMQGTLKINTCYLNAYQETGSAQTYTFPTAYSTTPALDISGGSCGTYNPTTTATVLTLPANAGMTAETCNIITLGQ